MRKSQRVTKPHTFISKTVAELVELFEKSDTMATTKEFRIYLLYVVVTGILMV